MVGNNNNSFENSWADSTYNDEYSPNNARVSKSKSGRSLTKKYSTKFTQSFSKSKEAASDGLGRTKEAASNGMKKVKDGASNGFSWFKQKFGKSSSGK